tara:strand:+ start:118 stop:447 length:330 start_codon:yes stop_codon:yes gene_type:complete
MPSYINDANAILNSDIYSEVFERKGVKYLRIRRTKDFSSLRGVEVEIAGEHVWTNTDSLFRLANEFLGSYDNWWVLALINKKPTDAHFTVGDIVFIPSDVSRIKEAFRE